MIALESTLVLKSIIYLGLLGTIQSLLRKLSQQVLLTTDYCLALNFSSSTNGVKNQFKS